MINFISLQILLLITKYSTLLGSPPLPINHVRVYWLVLKTAPQSLDNVYPIHPLKG